MRFNKKIAVRTGVIPVVHHNHGNIEFDNRSREAKFSFEGLMDKFDKKYGSGKLGQISLFAYYNPDKKECRLCYQKCKPMNTQVGTILCNVEDGMPHRVWIGKQTYCKLSRGHDARCMKRQGKLDTGKGEVPQCVCVEAEQL